MAAPKSRQQPFEELYRQLEEKVSLLEQGGLSLDDSLSAYEDAVKLAQTCQQLLDTAELRITRLKESMAGVAEAPVPYEALTDDDENEEVETPPHFLQ
jgi:exodeoxyribonuclease VII small subunit